jgi:hypothetical protein
MLGLGFYKLQFLVANRLPVRFYYRIDRERVEEGTAFLFSLSLTALPQKQQLDPTSSFVTFPTQCCGICSETPATR